MSATKGMIEIAISPAAYDAIRATLKPTNVLQPKRNSRGEYLIWLDDRIVARLARLRGQGENYSDVILRLARNEGGLG
jgi:hypothetical protein